MPALLCTANCVNKVFTANVKGKKKFKLLAAADVRSVSSREQRGRSPCSSAMSVTGNFFSKLRCLALTLEKETAQLEQVFTQEDSDYEEESPMRVLHDLRSDITGVKSDIQAAIDKTEKRGQELNNFLKICKVLQRRNASDLQQIRDTFQKYGYNPPDRAAAEHDDPAEEVVTSESADESCQSSDPQDLPPPPLIEKQGAWDLMRVPQLSDFGLSHYQLPVVWDPQINKKAPEEKSRPLYQDIRSINVAKTPKYALCNEEDFSQIQHFGISEYSANLNDDYTMALINKKKQSGPEKSKASSKDIKNLLATPAHLTYRSGTDIVDSPCPPTFCTPGLKVQKKDLNCTNPEPSESKEPLLVKNLDTPPLPSFKTKWLKSDTLKTLDITEPIPRPELSYNLQEAVPPVSHSDNYYENPTKMSSPPRMGDFSIGIPPRPEMTSCLTEDLLKHNLKLASPPKVSKYEHLLWTPTRPEMTSCITEDISQILARYCKNETKPSWQKTSENKENRP
ncbi:spindle and kinetochore-associated protein 3 [Ranitomeya variabilis]|uniref:spindle and kinetochore-associated protein 3 n=1 Tax=Ranitomeya variabilis TaxID=490064 RepID=UPI004057B7D1